MQFPLKSTNHRPAEPTKAPPSDVALLEPVKNEATVGVRVIAAANHWQFALGSYAATVRTDTRETRSGETLRQALEFTVAAIDDDHLQPTADAANAVRAAAALAEVAYQVSTLRWVRPT